MIDALATGIDLTPFFALLTNESVVKVFHAARQDIEIIWNMAGKIRIRSSIPRSPPWCSAMAIPFLRPAGAAHYRRHARQVEPLHRLDAAPADRRPGRLCALRRHPSARRLSQLADDLEKRGRTDWVEAEMRVLTSPETYRADPERAWERLKARVRKPKDLGVLMEVAAWREREAQTRDVPRSRVLKDDVVGEIAIQAPTTVEKLAICARCPRVSSVRAGDPISSRRSSAGWNAIPRRCPSWSDSVRRPTARPSSNCSRCCCA